MYLLRQARWIAVGVALLGSGCDAGSTAVVVEPVTFSGVVAEVESASASPGAGALLVNVLDPQRPRTYRVELLPRAALLAVGRDQVLRPIAFTEIEPGAVVHVTTDGREVRTLPSIVYAARVEVHGTLDEGV